VVGCLGGRPRGVFHLVVNGDVEGPSDVRLSMVMVPGGSRGTGKKHRVARVEAGSIPSNLTACVDCQMCPSLEYILRDVKSGRPAAQLSVRRSVRS